MSLLSATQGAPDRVWALVCALRSAGGVAPRAFADDWLNPGFERRETLVQEKPEAAAQTVYAAASLGAVATDDGQLTVASDCPVREAEFRDWTHDRLAALDSGEKDAVVLETYAWMAAESDRQGSTRWMQEWTRDRFADEADKALPEGADDDGQRRVNTTKMPALRRWLEYVGLMTSLPLPNALPQAAPTARLIRELRRDGAPTGQEIAAAEFLARLARRCPYLDGGRMFEAAARRIGHRPEPRRLSPLLTAALHDLDDAGLLSLGVRGDSGDVYRMAPNQPHRIQSVQFVVLNEGPVQ